MNYVRTHVCMNAYSHAQSDTHVLTNNVHALYDTHCHDNSVATQSSTAECFE